MIGRYEADINIVRGCAVKAARNMMGIDQREIAKLLKWSPAKLSNYENGTPIPAKSWKAVRVVMAKHGVIITVSRETGKVVLTGTFSEPPDTYDDDDDLLEIEEFTSAPARNRGVTKCQT